MLFYTADSFLCQYILEILKEGILTFRAQDNRLVPYYVRFNEAGKCYVIDYYHRTTTAAYTESRFNKSNILL